MIFLKRQGYILLFVCFHVHVLVSDYYHAVGGKAAIFTSDTPKSSTYFVIFHLDETELSSVSVRVFLPHLLSI